MALRLIRSQIMKNKAICVDLHIRYEYHFCPMRFSIINKRILVQSHSELKQTSELKQITLK